MKFPIRSLNLSSLPLLALAVHLGMGINLLWAQSNPTDDFHQQVQKVIDQDQDQDQNKGQEQTLADEEEDGYCPKNKDVWNIDLPKLLENYFKKNPQEDLAAFEKENPYFIKFCGLSKHHTRPGQDFYDIGPGFPTGHGVFFLKGACIDKSASEPRIRTCTPEELEANGPESEGIGISVNEPFKNVNWLAFPKKFFFDGDLDKDSILDQEEYEKILDKADQHYKPVDFHHRYYWPPRSYKVVPRRYFYARLMGSDYGLSLNRVSYCLNIPVNKSLMDDIVQSLNDINAKYSQVPCGKGKTKGPKYYWNPLKENCVHLGANLAADLGIAAKRRPTNKNMFWQLGHLTVPANFIIDIAHQTLNQDIDPQAIFENEQKRQIFMKYNWLPTQHGNLMEIIPEVKIKENQVFESDPTIYAFSKKFKPYTAPVPGRSLFKNFFSEKRYIKRKQAAASFQKKYEEALESLEKMKETMENDLNILKKKIEGKGAKNVTKRQKQYDALVAKSKEFAPFYDKFREYLKEQSAHAEKIAKGSLQ